MVAEQYGARREQLIGQAGQAPGSGLTHNAGPWIRAAGAADALRGQVGKVRAEFAAAHEGMAAGTQGLAVAGVLQVVRVSWERRIEAAAAECGELAGKLRVVARDQERNEATIASSFAGASASGPARGSAR